MWTVALPPTPRRVFTQCCRLFQGHHQTGAWGSPPRVHRRSCQPITIPSVCDCERGSHDSCLPSKAGHKCWRRDDAVSKDSTLQGLYGFWGGGGVPRYKCRLFIWIVDRCQWFRVNELLRPCKPVDVSPVRKDSITSVLYCLLLTRVGVFKQKPQE